MIKKVMENPLGLGLLVLIFFLIVMLPFELIPKLKNNKKVKIIVMISLVIIAAIIFIPNAIISNPKVEATINDDYVQFKMDEKVYFDDIEKIEYLDNVDLAVTANGFRWGNDDYYSGDANVEAIDKKDGSTILSVYKGKVYIDKDVDDYIVVTSNHHNKTFIFNYSTKEKTKEVFKKLDARYSVDI